MVQSSDEWWFTNIQVLFTRDPSDECENRERATLHYNKQCRQQYLLVQEYTKYDSMHETYKVMWNIDIS